MLTKDIMTKYLKMCRSNATVKDAAQIMKDLNCGIVPVVDENNRLVGVVTDRDITLYTILNNKNPEKTTLDEFMTKDVITASPDDDVDDVIQKMKNYKIRRIPVIDRDNKLVGLISLGDIAVITGEEHEVFEALENISFPISGAK